MSDFTLKKRSTFEKFYTKPIKKDPLLSDFTLKEGPLLRNFSLNQNERSTFVRLHAKKGPLLRNFTLNQKKSTFVRFHVKKDNNYFVIIKLLRNSTLKQKKDPLLSDFTLKNGPLLRNFALNQKKVHFCQCNNKTFEEFYAKQKKIYLCWISR